MYRRVCRMLIGPAWALSIAASSIAASPVAIAAAEADPEEVLKAKGLRRLSPYFSLPEEMRISKQVRDAGQLKRKVFDAKRNLAACERKVEEKQELIVSYLQRRREIRAQLGNTTSITIHNRLVSALNELADRIALMQQGGREEEALKAARAAAGSESEKYIEHVLQTRTLYETVREKYQDLAADATVKAAVGQYSKTSGKTYRLGPTAGFATYGRTLKKLEESVLSESIPLRKGGGDLWHVSVMFGGKYTVEMALDTGASVIALPWKTSEKLGMSPGSQSPIIRLQLADGRIIEAREVFAESVRVGKFTVEHVRCAVLPREAIQATPLLGQSFLKHFSFKIDTANAKLIMSKVETPEAGGRSRPRRTR